VLLIPFDFSNARIKWSINRRGATTLQLKLSPGVKTAEHPLTVGQTRIDVASIDKNSTTIRNVA
jgi:hypothetical protein